MTAGGMAPLERVTVADANQEVAFAGFFDAVRQITQSLNRHIAKEQVIVDVSPLLPARPHKTLAFRAFGHVLGDRDAVELRTSIEPRSPQRYFVVRVSLTRPISELRLCGRRIVVSPPRREEPFSAIEM